MTLLNHTIIYILFPYYYVAKSYIITFFLLLRCDRYKKLNFNTIHRSLNNNFFPKLISFLFHGKLTKKFHSIIFSW